MEDFVGRGFVTFDYPVWIGLASCSCFYAMTDVTAAYRVSGGSISNNVSYQKRDAFQSGIDEIVRYSVERALESRLISQRQGKELLNERVVKRMILALAFNKFERYLYFCREIDPSLGLKWAVLRYVPWVFRLKKRHLIGTGCTHKLFPDS